MKSNRQHNNDLLKNAITDRDLKPWRYYQFSIEKLEEWLDKYAERFGSLDETKQQ